MQVHQHGEGRIEIVRMLIDEGADVNLQHTGEGQTALIRASWSDNTEIVRMLIDEGATKLNN